MKRHVVMIINCLTIHSIIINSNMMTIFLIFSSDEGDWLKKANKTNLLGAICGKIEP